MTLAAYQDTDFINEQNFVAANITACMHMRMRRNSDSHASIRMSLIIHEMTPRVRRHVIRLLSRCYVYVRQHGGDYYLPALLERKRKITGDYTAVN